MQPFNANNFDPTQSSGGLPIGRHPVIVESSEVRANKANDGTYLQLNLKVIDGPNAGTVGAYRLNLYHSNPQVVEIASRQLSAISHVTGVFMIQDSAQLHNIPFVIEVGPQKNDPQYTEVKKVFDINGNEPGKAPQGGGAQQQQPNAAQQGGSWQPPAGNGQQQPPANGGGAWGAQQGGAQPNNGAGFEPPADQQQQPQPQADGQAGGQAGGWQQGATAGGAAPWAQR